MTLAAGGAHAGTLPFTATLSIEIGIFAKFSIEASGIATANGSGGSSHITSLQLAGSTFATTGFVLPVTDPFASPIVGVKLTAHNGPAAFADGGNSLGGVMPIAGVAKICLFQPCGSAIANISVPLSVVGVGGFANVGLAVNLTVVGAPWTTGTGSVGSITAMGSAYGPASGTSSTFAPGGRLQLVTPIFVFADVALGVTVPSFATLTIDFVPEPATLLLLGSGVAALGFAGLARRG